MGEHMDYRQVINETQKLLLANPEWCERYAAYAASISENADFIRNSRSRFREWSPLKLYLNITNAKNAKRTVAFKLHYLGQTVAKLTCYHDNLKLSTATYEQKNLRDLIVRPHLQTAIGMDWKPARFAPISRRFHLLNP